MYLQGSPLENYSVCGTGGIQCISKVQLLLTTVCVVPVGLNVSPRFTFSELQCVWYRWDSMYLQGTPLVNHSVCGTGGIQCISKFQP